MVAGRLVVRLKAGPGARCKSTPEQPEWLSSGNGKLRETGPSQGQGPGQGRGEMQSAVR